MPFMAVHTSRAALWDTLSSRPADLTVFAGSRFVIEYPHSGIDYISPVVQTNCRTLPYMLFVFGFSLFALCLNDELSIR